MVKHRFGNQNVTKILTVVTRKQALRRLAMDIFEFCIKNNIQLVPEWIPRIDNQMVDLMPKQLALDDNLLDPNLFATADIRWAPTLWIHVDLALLELDTYQDFVVLALSYCGIIGCIFC